jgi:hypothetical protein
MNTTAESPIRDITKTDTTKHTLSKSFMYSVTSEVFDIPLSLQDRYNQYYLMYWKGSHLRELLKDGILVHTWSIPYQVRYIDCTPEEVFSASQVALSFRQPNPELNIVPMVLVRLSGLKKSHRKET